MRAGGRGRLLKKSVQQGRREWGDWGVPFFSHPPRAAETAHSPVGTSQGDARL